MLDKGSYRLMGLQVWIGLEGITYGIVLLSEADNDMAI